MEYWALHILFDRADDCAVASETLAAVLDELGAVGWHETALAETGEATLCAFFPASVPRQRAIERVGRVAEVQHAENVLRSKPRLRAAAIEEHDWVETFRQYFRGVRIAPGLRVVPPWRAARGTQRTRQRRTEIIILPGMAFGTGMHETTRLCLRLLRRETHGGERVADIGAGSGILSVGALLFGARSAVAIEEDPQAHENLKENIRLNHVGRRMRVFPGTLAQYMRQLADDRRRVGPRVGFDLIVCNILFEKMRPLLCHFGDLARPAAATTVITSGHLWSERLSARDALAAAGVCIRYERRLGDWGAFVGRIGK